MTEVGIVACLGTFGGTFGGNLGTLEMHASAGCAETIFAVTKMAQMSVPKASGMSRKKFFREEEFALRLVSVIWPITDSITSDMKKRSGARGFVHKKSSLGFYLNGGGSNCCPTFFGNLTQLFTVLELAITVNENASKNNKLVYNTIFDDSKCSLRIAAPSLQTVKRLVDAASNNLVHNPGSFGVDPDANCYFAVKTLTDMRALVKGLVDGKTYEKNTKAFKVEFLNYPKGVF